MSATSAPAESSVAAFDAVADGYDDVFTRSQIGIAQRAAVHAELDRVFLPGQRVLELNCGTGVDALYLTSMGVQVLACDASPRMIEVARQHWEAEGSSTRTKFRVLATERIAELEGEGPFDGAFSNFGGLNCVEDLSTIARHLAQLLRPGARALLCLFGRAAPWEIVWYLGHGNPRKALRRFARDGAIGHLAEGAAVKVQYPSVRAVVRMFAPAFRLVRFKGIGVTVPPSYASAFVERFPRALGVMARLDARVSAWPVLRGLADHILFEFQRVPPA